MTKNSCKIWTRSVYLRAISPSIWASNGLQKTKSKLDSFRKIDGLKLLAAKWRWKFLSFFEKPVWNDRVWIICQIRWFDCLFRLWRIILWIRKCRTWCNTRIYWGFTKLIWLRLGSVSFGSVIQFPFGIKLFNLMLVFLFFNKHFWL